MQDHMTPHDHRGRLPYGRTWPHRGNAPGPIQALAEFLVAPARLVQQTIGLGVVAKTFAGILVLMVVMLGTNTAPMSSAPASPSPTRSAREATGRLEKLSKSVARAASGTPGPSSSTRTSSQRPADPSGPRPCSRRESRTV